MIGVLAWLVLLEAIPNHWVHGAAREQENVLEAAKKEGRLVLYTGMDTEEANQFTKEL
jgi:hypothetical protein